MCRFVVYKGPKVLLSAITHDPEHSLVNQSKNGGYHPGCEDKLRERNLVVNGDGFGIAFYPRDWQQREARRARARGSTSSTRRTSCSSTSRRTRTRPAARTCASRCPCRARCCERATWPVWGGRARDE